MRLSRLDQEMEVQHERYHSITPPSQKNSQDIYEL